MLGWPFALLVLCRWACFLHQRHPRSRHTPHSNQRAWLAASKWALVAMLLHVHMVQPCSFTANAPTISLNLCATLTTVLCNIALFGLCVVFLATNSFHNAGTCSAWASLLFITLALGSIFPYFGSRLLVHRFWKVLLRGQTCPCCAAFLWLHWLH